MSTFDPTLPVHPVTGLAALAVIGGRPVWPVLGAAPDDEDDDTATDEAGDDDGDDAADQGDDGDDGDDTEPDGAEQLGDAGKRALDKMKAKWRKERDQRRGLEQKLAKSGSKTGSEGEQPDTEEIRRQAQQEATSKANQRILRSEVKASAAGKLADPADAYRFLDLEQFEVDENGDVDSDEIDEKITELLSNKPYLAAPAKRFQGSGDGGARKGSRPKQITSREELAKLPAGERLKAYNEGRLKNLLND